MRLIIDISNELYNSIMRTWEKIHPKMWEMLKNAKPYEERPKCEWIPITYRPMTEEEEKDVCERVGVDHLEDDDKRIFSCHLPDDGQEILISVGKYVHEDICSWDEYGCCLENNGDWEGVDAWMPFPEPYKKGGVE